MSAERKIAAAVLAGTIAVGGIGYAATRGEQTPPPSATERPSAAAASPTPEKTASPTIAVRTPEPMPMPIPTPEMKTFNTIMVNNPPPASLEDAKTVIQNAVDAVYKDPRAESVWPQTTALGAINGCETTLINAQAKVACSFTISKFWEVYSTTGSADAYKITQITYNFGLSQGPWRGAKAQFDNDLKIRIPQNQFKS